jgi:hypothetical protein
MINFKERPNFKKEKVPPYFERPPVYCRGADKWKVNKTTCYCTKKRREGREGRRDKKTLQSRLDR